MGSIKDITPQTWYVLKRYAKFTNQTFDPISSAVALSNALYLLSLLESYTVACFRELLQTILRPNTIANPLLECFSSRQSAHSVSEKALRIVEYLVHIAKCVIKVSN
jgi:hypothetical protein